MTYYLERALIDTKNFEERVALLTRMIDIMCVFEELNNFNGIMEFFSALHSSSVYRLELTKKVALVRHNDRFPRKSHSSYFFMEHPFEFRACLTRNAKHTNTSAT